MIVTDDRAAVTAVIASLLDAWARHDADAFGALFTDNATYITWLGTYSCGRREIAESHRALWTKFLKGTRLADQILDVRLVGPDTAVVTSRGDTYKRKRPKKLTKVQTYTLVHESDGHWRIAAFQNTKRKPLFEAMMPRSARETPSTRG
ncbi:MAG TPA: SgcJ/EcaC family oxidoreductase [Ktedonobacterales bacterium]|nr:SgcJ/EcaC family oxidoreductase [Ktedonobacterales bacterium]